MLNTTNQRLNHFVKYLGLTHKEFAVELKTSQTAISAILSGSRSLSRGMVARIASKFPMLNLKWLHNGEGEMLNSNKDGGDSDFIGGNGDIIKKNTIIEEIVEDSTVESVSDDPNAATEITRLKSRLFDMEEEIASLKAKLKRKEKEIKELKAQLNK